MTSPSLTPDELKAQALALGFLACGIADLSPSTRSDALDEWLALGYAGTMRYLHRQANRRKAPATIEPAARCAVIVLDNYYAGDADPSPSLKVAKYARGEDYHRALMRRLETLAEFLRERGAAVARIFGDAGPVPERELAQRAGLGWIGKNTMLIRPGAGSYTFIGSVFTDLDLTTDAPFDLDRCGTCTRCLDACPTDAFVAPRRMDATRCIAYLTIEQRGPIPDDLADKMDGWAFGCDICNDVCPWNERFATPTTVAAYHPRGELVILDDSSFDTMDETEFVTRFGDTPLERPGLTGMRRNVLAARRSQSIDR